MDYDYCFEVLDETSRIKVLQNLKDKGYKWAGGEDIYPERDAEIRYMAKYFFAGVEYGEKIIRYGSAKGSSRYKYYIKWKAKKSNVDRYGGAN